MWRFAAVLVLVSTALSAQMNYFADGSRTLSAFVKAQFFIWRPGEIELFVLWRGSDARSFAGSGSSRGGGNAEGYTGVFEFGAHRFDFVYDRSRRVVRVRGTEISLPQGHHVLLVDGADRDGDPSITTLKADLRYPVVGGRGAAPAPIAAADIVAIVERSPEMLSFLRCSDGATNQLPARVSGYICSDLKSR
jgi:hypothetical protein